ncbi:protein kinase domain-containing protein [Loktanella agnita]|uniref:protein kinase domain-containing protein n=1 Tax=Loktanella agnita TaxID=287097 RepID=UPI003985BD70
MAEDKNNPAPDPDKPEAVDDDRTRIATGPVTPVASDNDKTEISDIAVSDAAGTDDHTRIAPAPVTQPDRVPEPAPVAAPSVPPVPKPAPDVPPAPRGGQHAPVPIGTLINNNYEIKQLINAGGMGEVFRGENVFTGDAVAIKIVLQSLAHDEKVAALFMREARVLCQLSDQAIVRYYNFVKDAALDRFCLIMEFIEGIALSDHIRDVAPLSLHQAVGLMRRVAAGLGRAHQMEVIHRDLSPDNVMLRGGSVDDAVLIDFGIAKSAEMAESTLHGQLAGKFKYISPEQLGHFGGAIGPRTDIYGLALMMAAALRGKPLDMGASVVEAVNARREIPDLSDIDPALRPLLAHMLEPDPNDRPARMSDVIALLDDPSAIPAQYGTARPVTQTTPPKPSPVIADVPGLSQPPGRAQTTGGFGGGAAGKSDPASQSPFGENTGLPPSSVASLDNDGGGGLLRWLLVLLVLAGVGGFIAWQQGLLGPAGVTPVQTELAQEATDGRSALDPSTREGFLAAWPDQDCTYVTRIPSGPNSGLIAGFAATADSFATLPDDYDGAFGARPAVLETVISDAQCPVLTLSDALRQKGSVPPIVTLDSTVMASEGAIVGRVSNRRARPVWLAVVLTDGGVYNLSDRLTEQADGSATFSLSLAAEEGSAAQPQLVIAVASDKPLLSAAASQDGAPATRLLPLIEAELTGRDDPRAGAAVAGFELRP